MPRGLSTSIFSLALDESGLLPRLFPQPLTGDVLGRGAYLSRAIRLRQITRQQSRVDHVSDHQTQEKLFS